MMRHVNAHLKLLSIILFFKQLKCDPSEVYLEFRTHILRGL